ncbi:hypothetical protein DNU06_01585 [Putridiphycobacter roseus]|uniref:Peptidase C14 caspase domain-containing protein n=1 Tax=Putridiphycobacter roseus TaxID=2219161 RepID=A0A2W1N5W8_9FLAO|nr:caspase family protein [Putridiphycobacter roseus]PZE18551.1 hypothetical protein DNU06_01585 [Putridiphycobacter roseus]
MRTILLLFLLSFFSLLHAQTKEASKIEAIIQMGHSKKMTASDLSKDGKYIATGSMDRSIIIWERKTGKQIRVLHHHVKSVIALHFSRDGKKILSASNDNTVKLTNVLTGEVIHSFKHEKYDIANAYFNGDESRVIVIDKRDKFSIWDTYSGEWIGVFTKNYVAYDENETVSFNGTKALTLLNNKQVACVDLTTKDTLFTLPVDNGYTLHFSANGAYVVIGSEKLFTSVFDANTGAFLHTVMTNEDIKCNGCKTQVRITKDSKAVFTISNKGEGKLWNIKNGKIIQKITVPKDSPDNIVLSDDYQYLLLTMNDHIMWYHLGTGKLLWKMENEDIDYYEIHLLDGYMLLPGDYQSVELWSLFRKKAVQQYSGYLNQHRADGLSFNYSNWIDAGILQYISYKTGLAIHPTKNEVAMGKIDSSAIVLDLLTGKKVKTIQDAEKANFCQDYSADGKWLAIAGGDRIIRVYDADSYQLMHTLKGHQSLVFDLSFAADPNVLVSASWDGTIRTWDIENEKWTAAIKLDKVSPYIVQFSPHDLYILSGDLDKSVDFWEADTKTKFRTLIGHQAPIASIEFSENGEQLLTASWDGKIKLWHALTGMQLAKFNDKGAPIYTAIFSKNQEQIIAGDGDRKIKFWNIKSGKLVVTLSGHISAVTDLKLTKDGKLMVSRGANGEVIVWDMASKKQLYTYMQINSEDWLVTTPNGQFDGSKNALNLVNYVSGMEVVNITAMFDRYYSPNLAKRVMAGEKMEDTGENFNALMKDRPELAFQMLNSKSRNVFPADSTIQSKTKAFSIEVNVLEHNNEIAAVRIYNNGKLIDSESSFNDLNFRGEKEYAKHFEIDLIDGLNNITAVAVGKNKIESDPISMQVLFDGEAAKTDLYIFSIGINRYKNPNYNLTYAVKDAQDFSKNLAKGGTTLFNKIVTYKIEDDKANKAEILAVFEKIKAEVGPEDVFVFYYAGHGVMSLGDENEGEKFYIVTHNITSFFGTDLLYEEGISATELLDFSKEIAAQKQLFILDACHSGGALNELAMRGDGREKAIAQLARNTGTFFLTASQDVQYANESGDLKHGLFTYALLEIIGGVSEGNKLDNKITVNEIKTYVEERVPELSEKYHGSAQYPTSYSFGQDFPIVIVK